ncbi:SOD-1 superoxide dismutase (Cu-Zn) [Balamuthia mandrillaris]
MRSDGRAVFVVAVCCVVAAWLFVLPCEARKWELTASCRMIPTTAGKAAGFNGGLVTLYTINATASLGVNITAQLLFADSASAAYAMSIREFGDIADPTGNNTGGEFVGGGSTTHACPPDARPDGALGNWTRVDKSILQSQTYNQLTLQGPNSVIGHSIVLYSKHDDCSANPNLGDILGQCVIGISDSFLNRAESGNVGTLKAICALNGTSACNGTCNGVAYFLSRNSDADVEITVQIPQGLTNGSVHGIHIGTAGDLSLNSAASTGNIFNPYSSSHALPGTYPRMIGDLGNIQTYDSKGVAWYRYVDDWVDSIDSIIGRSLIITTGFDHGQGAGCDSEGSAGAPLLACVIGLAAADTIIPHPPVDINFNFTNQDCASPPIPIRPSKGNEKEVDSLVAAVVVGWVFVAVLAFCVIGLVVIMARKKGDYQTV